MGEDQKRPTIPKATREKLLVEFNNRCAICGNSNPQIHHIDQNASNNALENLIPLCPNCHLIDQHNPTRRTDPRKLMLFRRYKDPSILTPQFEPLFHRLEFILALENTEFSGDLAQTSAEDLIAFVNELEKGAYYGASIRELLRRPPGMYVLSSHTPDHEIEQQYKEGAERFLEQLKQNRDDVLRLCVELLRYRGWVRPNPDRY